MESADEVAKTTYLAKVEKEAKEVFGDADRADDLE